MDPQKDVFVKFQSPACKHSKRLEPIWEELAKAYLDNPKFVVATLDATKNEHVEGGHI